MSNKVTAIILNDSDELLYLDQTYGHKLPHLPMTDINDYTEYANIEDPIYTRHELNCMKSLADMLLSHGLQVKSCQWDSTVDGDEVYAVALQEYPLSTPDNGVSWVHEKYYISKGVKVSKHT